MLYDPNIFNLNFCFLKVLIEGRVIRYTKATLFVSVHHLQIPSGGAVYTQISQF